MSDAGVSQDILDHVRDRFRDANITIVKSSVRQFPGETIVILEVGESDLTQAITLANSLDNEIMGGFITVKKARQDSSTQQPGRVKSLIDPRVNDLVEVLSARSRTSEQQPSLHYVIDVAQNLSLAASRRHHLVFGRRGVGKTSLLLEAKKLVETRGAATFWINVHTMRSLSAYDAFLTTAARVCDIPAQTFAGRAKPPLSVARAKELRGRIGELMNTNAARAKPVDRLVPQLQELLQTFGRETSEDLYLFLDDIHYLGIKQQPVFLDMIHSMTRDTSTWIKAAGIKHQTRWFIDNPPTGLQTGHDAAIINLDVTLEQPAKAKDFLTAVLQTYADETKIGNPAGIISREALDRLVLASGGVPRDFLVLCATAVQLARQRTNAKTIGVQDVNEAAGKNAQPKLQELEDDAASSLGHAESRKSALNCLRDFLLNDQKVTYFRVDFRDKEDHPREYDLLQSLMDLRLVHLINAGLSDERHAGRRSEVYMLDLSQFSGTRFMRNLKVLDFTKGHLVLKSTGGTAVPRLGDTSKRLQSILRRGPLFDLEKLGSFIKDG